MLAEGKKFVIAVPFSNSFARKQVEDCKDLIDDFSNNIVIGTDTLRAITKKRKWGNKYVYAYVFYNPIKAVTDREKLYKKVSDMLEKATSQPEKFINNKDFTQYLNIQMSKCGNYFVEVKKDAIAAAKRYSGWLLLIGNSARNSVEVLNIYCAKDVAEKGFLRLKNSLDLARLRVHSDLSMQSKVFICFIALVLISNIHNIMVENGLYKVYTMKLLMNVLSKRRSQNIGKEKIELPLIRKQRIIYSAFGLEV